MQRLTFSARFALFLLGATAIAASLDARHGLLPRAGDQQAQTPAPGPTTGTGLLMGVVVDPLTDRPVAGSVVSVGLDNRKVLTDAQGRFVFTDLPERAYTITATKPGYVEGAFGRRRPAGPAQTVRLAEGERLGDLRVPIWKHASITGTITDEGSDPMVDVPVRILTRTFVAGRRKLSPGVIVRTDDRGVYRFGSLVPAEYVVVVPSTQASAPESMIDAYRQGRMTRAGSEDIMRDASSAGATTTLNAMSQSSGFTIGGVTYRSSLSSSRAGVTPSPSADGRMFVYPTQYYPAATTGALATAITLRSGEERSGVDLQLRLVPTARISGTVVGPEGPVIAGLSLVSGSGDLSIETGLESATTISDAAGRFMFLGVPAGQYQLRAIKLPPGATRGGPPPSTTSTPTLSATQSLSVDTADVQNIAVVLRAGFRITGRIEFDDPVNQPAPALVPRTGATIESADGRPMPSTTVGRGVIDIDGQFSSYQLPPGRYLLRVTTPPVGWVLKSATLGGQDISNVALALDRDMGGLVITFTNRPGDLNGRVQNASGAADATATVLILPADAALWVDYGENPRRPRAVRVDPDGAWRAAGLPTGDYLIIAIPDDAAALWHDPSMLQKLARLATPIAFIDGETRSLALKTVAVPR